MPLPYDGRKVRKVVLESRISTMGKRWWELPRNSFTEPMYQLFDDQTVKTININFEDGSNIRYRRKKGV